MPDIHFLEAIVKHISEIVPGILHGIYVMQKRNFDALYQRCNGDIQLMSKQSTPHLSVEQVEELLPFFQYRTSASGAGHD